MSWKRVHEVSRRFEFVKLALRAQQSISQLCRKFGWSRKRGHKWRRRFERDGMRGLYDRKRRPENSPQRTNSIWLNRIRGLRRRYPSWGSRKLWARLRKDYVGQTPPAARTIDKWLRTLKLTRRIRRRRLSGPRKRLGRLTRACRSNHVWTVDFKGWFRTQDGGCVHPLTVRDLFSRYLLCVRLLPDQRWQPIQQIFLRLFQWHGYPSVIRMDNGSPFGSTGAAGLSQLSAWWTALGIQVEFIAPGQPQQNGSHEQMHRVLKFETTRPTSQNRRAQQRRTDRWRDVYNNVRPHEALRQRTPGEIYRRRLQPLRTPVLSYPRHWEVRRVRSNGQIKWQGRKRMIGEAFAGYKVGIKPVRSAKNDVYFASLLIGQLWQRDVGGIRAAKYFRR